MPINHQFSFPRYVDENCHLYLEICNFKKNFSFVCDIHPLTVIYSKFTKLEFSCMKYYFGWKKELKIVLYIAKNMNPAFIIKMINFEFLFLIACFLILISVIATLVIICKMLTFCAINQNPIDKQSSVADDLELNQCSSYSN